MLVRGGLAGDTEAGGFTVAGVVAGGAVDACTAGVVDGTIFRLSATSRGRLAAAVWAGLGATVGTGAVNSDCFDTARALVDGDAAMIAGKVSAAGSEAGAGQLSAAVIPAIATTRDAATAIVGRVRRSGARSRRGPAPLTGTSGAPRPSA